jgi:hypothetical protein
MTEGAPPHVSVGVDVLTIGTHGLGEGRVSYMVGDRYDAYTREALRLS